MLTREQLWGTRLGSTQRPRRGLPTQSGNIRPTVRRHLCKGTAWKRQRRLEHMRECAPPGLFNCTWQPRVHAGAYHSRAAAPGRWRNTLYTPTGWALTPRRRCFLGCLQLQKSVGKGDAQQCVPLSPKAQRPGAGAIKAVTRAPLSMLLPGLPPRHWAGGTKRIPFHDFEKKKKNTTLQTKRHSSISLWFT